MRWTHLYTQNPLLVGALLLRHFGHVLNTGVKLTDLASFNATQAQELADVVQGKVTHPHDAAAGTSTVHLIGGLEVQVHDAFSRSNGHVMEDALI